MADEAAITIVMKMRDEASQKMADFGAKTQELETQLTEAGTIMGVAGVAMTAFALLAANAADENGVLADAVGKAKEQLGEFMRQVGEGVIPILLIFLDVVTTVLKLVNQLPGPILKIGGGLALMGGAALTAVGAILLLIVTIGKLWRAFQALIQIQLIQKALTGPIGWAQIAGGLAVAAGAGAVIYGMTRLATSGGGGGGSTVIVNSPAFTGSRADARKFGTEMQTYQRQNTRVGR